MIKPEDLKSAGYEYQRGNGLHVWFRQDKQEVVLFLEADRGGEPKGPVIAQYEMMIGSQPNRQVFSTVVELHKDSTLPETELKISKFRKAVKGL